MISKDKQYRTRDGREVRIYATDGHPDEPVHGALKDYSGEWNAAIWYLTGKCRFGKCVSGENCADLIEVKPRIKRTVWLNVYNDGWVSAFSSKQIGVTTMSEGNKLIACVKVEIDVEEGEGL